MYEIKKRNIVLPALNITFSAEDIYIYTAWLWGALHGWFKAWSKVKFFSRGMAVVFL